MLHEDEQNEFKRTTGELNEAMLSVSAILNKHGNGTIYFGLKNDGTPFKFTITGSTIRDVSRKVYEAIKPQIFPEVQTVFMDGIEVIKLSFSGKERPYSAFGKYYMRVADEDKEMTPGELRRMMIDQEYEENWEDKSSKESIDDVDEKVLKRFFEKAVECGRLPLLEGSTDSLLKKLGLINGKMMTNAGRLLFSKNKPLTLKMAVFATEHKSTFLDISRADGNIFELIDCAVAYIIKNIRWSSKIGSDGIHREEIPEIPIEAVREAVINSFAHARYDISVQHEIDIFSNRLSITNPGKFAAGFRPEDFAVRDLHSVLRNEVIAKTLYLCKDVETFGSGLRKIYSLCKERKVRISYTDSETAFSLEFSRTDRNNMPADGTINDTISDLENNILMWLREDGKRTIANLVDISGKSQRTITRAIANLKNKGLIKRVGANKTGHWELK